MAKHLDNGSADTAAERERPRSTSRLVPPRGSHGLVPDLARLILPADAAEPQKPAETPRRTRRKRSVKKT